MKKLKIKIITGFREDQHITIDADEAHKAYYLFLNPEKRGVFNSGLALIGKNISEIRPDYNATIGWNPTHELKDDDWNEIKAKGIDIKLQSVLSLAKQTAYLANSNPELLNKALSEAGTIKELPVIKSEQIKSIGEFINEKEKPNSA